MIPNRLEPALFGPVFGFPSQEPGTDEEVPVESNFEPPKPILFQPNTAQPKSIQSGLKLKPNKDLKTPTH